MWLDYCKRSAERHSKAAVKAGFMKIEEIQVMRKNYVIYSVVCKWFVKKIIGDDVWST